MLVFPPMRPELREEGCRIARWMPAERFAPYFARPTVLPRLPTQVLILDIKLILTKPLFILLFD